jgi:eukaryotic-like serine/threonine-protein kinase
MAGVWARRVGIVVAVCAAIGFVGQGATPATAATSYSGKWPFFRYSAGRTSFNPVETILSASNADSLTEAWQHVFTSGGNVGLPLVFQGRVYVTYRGSVVVLEPRSGKTVRRTRLHDPLDGLGISRGIVYATGGHAVYALDASTGELVWSEPGAFEGWPVVANGVLYVSQIVDPSGMQAFDAFDAKTGAQIWSTPTECAVQFPAVHNGIVVVHNCDTGRVVALDAATGSQLWSFQDAHAELIVGGAYVYVEANGPSGNGVYALSAKTGAIRWSFTSSNGIGVPEALANGVLYAGGSPLYALDATTGKMLWSASGLYASAVAKGVIYTASGGIEAADASTGLILGTFAPPDGAQLGSPLAIADGTLYAVAAYPVPEVVAIRPQ